MDTSSCYLVFFQTIQRMVQWNDGNGEQFSWMRPRSVQHMETFHAPGLALLLGDLRHIWNIPVLKTPHELLGIHFYLHIDASSSHFRALNFFPPVHVF